MRDDATDAARRAQPILACAVLAALLAPACDDAEVPGPGVASSFTLDAGTAPDAAPMLEDEEPAGGEASAPGAQAPPEPEIDYPTGGIYYFTANVRASPTRKSTLLGHIRRGTVLRIDGPQGTDGCADGWYRLVDSMGYVCRTEGLRVNDVQAYVDSPSPPHQPWFDAILPYDYSHVMRNDVPAYNKIPTAAEQKEVAKWLAERRAVLEAQIEAIEKALAEGTVLENPYDIVAEIKNPDGTVETVAVPDAYTQDVEEGPVPTDIPFKFVTKILLRGFYVSLDKKVWRNGSLYYKTLRGLYVKSSAAHVIAPPTSRGAELGGDLTLPVGIVTRMKISAYTSEDGGATIKPAKPMTYKRFSVLPIIEEITTGTKAYYNVGGGMYVRKGDVRRVDRADPPTTIKEPGQKWIDIAIKKQVITAYEGETPVYVALISSGREKQNIEFKTPRGFYAISSKHVTGTMDNLYATDGPYAIEDVPWTMYFTGSYAIHGAFWHNGFGQVRSHGCVNMTPHDARWLFYWTDPHLPAGWHSAYANKDLKGTLVKIHD
ncbi:MAG: L,D-transpeptidase [Deltaproteobacteria bacterium]|nr:L,D-transpeptidase [Deltaproteobacteria bacterium]